MGKKNWGPKSQTAVIKSLSEVKEFDKIQTARDDQKQNGIKPHAPVKMATRKNVNAEVQAISPDNIQHMGRNAWNTTKWTISERCAGVQKAVQSTM